MKQSLGSYLMISMNLLEHGQKMSLFPRNRRFLLQKSRVCASQIPGFNPLHAITGKKQQRITLRVWNRNKSHKKLSILFFILAHCVWALDVGPTFFLPSLWFSSFLLLKFMSVWAYL